MALTCKAFGDIITFTRASTATFTGSNGLIQSAAIDAPRFDYDPVTLAAKGLLIEEQRTNLLTYSEQFDNAAWVKTNSTITANATTAPDGTVAADKLVEDTATSTHQAYQNFVGTVAPYTFSVYAKAGERTVVTLLHGSGNSADYDLVAATATGSGASIAPVGNGWYRCIITQTLPDTANRSYAVRLNNGSGVAYTGNGTSGAFIWGAQLEAGSFATSYIPTVASQVTRSADVASVNTLSPWYNATEGTLYAEAGRPALGGNSPAATLFTSTTARIQAGNNVGGGGTTEADFYVQNVADQAWLRFAGAVSANTTFKIAGAYKVNDFAASANGGAVATDTSGTVPSVTSLLLGANGTIGVAFNGWLRRITYYPRRLSNAELQAITA